LTTNQHGVTTEQVVSIKYIDEGNLYRLIIRSKKPEARAFEKWVFDIVLPSIRKHGAYITPELLDELQDYEGIQLIPFSAVDGSGVEEIKEVIEDYISEEE
jgi:prophage antirepressor-like protein